MAIYTIADYQVKASGADKVRAAVEAFVPYIRDNEPRTRLYEAWQHKEDPSHFVHFFIFEDEEASVAHGNSSAVKRFEAAYRPELLGSDVTFTNYRRVATNQDASAAKVLQAYYEAAINRDFEKCSQLLVEKLEFRGLFRTYHCVH